MPHFGHDVPHDSAAAHAAGASLFIDDLPPARGELLCDIVGSPVAHGEILSVDTAAAARVPGVIAILTSGDIFGHNDVGPVAKDEKLLVDRVATHLGAPIALIVAETREALAAATKLVRVGMRPLPPILTIDEALAAGAFLTPELRIERGSVDEALAAAPYMLEGMLRMGGQDHFYFETQIAIAYPGEGGTMLVESSTQHPSEVQAFVAEALGIPFNHVTVTCRRMGGAFGGKETQAAFIAALAAVAARQTGRPCRLMLSRDDDMRITGKRHPFQARYRVGFDKEGLIVALDAALFSNGGDSLDLSSAVMERALLHADNAYFIPNLRAIGRVCRTNLPSNTAFRGFGGPQGITVIEHAIEKIAATLKLDALDIRRRNCYGIETRNQTPYGQVVSNNTLPRLFEELPRRCDYARRRAEIEQFNARSTTMLRGISLTAVKFGISFTRRTLNQANALVNIYQDGTILVSSGATEMGQGVNTRVRQLVADAFGIPADHVRVTATTTDKNNNTSPTAASAGTDLNGAAALDACRRLRERLAAIASQLLADPATGQSPDPALISFAEGAVYDSRTPARRITFRDLVCQSYEQRVNLGERGFYATPGVDFNRETGRGNPFLYFTNGVACTEVLIDRFTGEMRVVRADVLMDIGRSLNPGIDRGQITGGFVQGMGWCTTEELRYSPSGELLAHSPTTYKIPNISDLPEIFNVDWLDNSESSSSLMGTKAVGEPPLLLGISAWTAVLHALMSAAGGLVDLELPATGEQILSVLTRHARRPTTIASGG